jgi:hypothetical protein
MNQPDYLPLWRRNEILKLVAKNGEMNETFKGQAEPIESQARDNRVSLFCAARV